MGYTHYWTQQKSFAGKEWKALTAFAERAFKLAAEKGVKLAGESDESEEQPLVSETAIVFNGVGAGGHETFVLVRKLPPPTEIRYGGMSFCKTARKDYDIVVCAVLLRARVLAPGKISLASDGAPGEDEEWDRAILFYNELVDDEPLTTASARALVKEEDAMESENEAEGESAEGESAEAVSEDAANDGELPDIYELPDGSIEFLTLAGLLARHEGREPGDAPLTIKVTQTDQSYWSVKLTLAEYLAGDNAE